MPSNLRVGALDHPERFGRKSVAVYTNSNGPYFVLDGVRESVHGSQLWTTHFQRQDARWSPRARRRRPSRR